MKFTHYLLALLMLCPLLSTGQGLIAQRVFKAADNNEVATYTLVNPTNLSLKDAGISEEELTEGLIVSLNTDVISTLQQERPEVLDLRLPLLGLGMQTVTLIPSKVLKEDFILTTSSGRAIDYEPGLYYQGILNGDPNTLVAISIFDKEIHGLISTDDGNFVIGKIDNGVEDAHLIYNDRDLLGDWDLGCETPDDGEVYKASQLEFDYSKSVGDCIRVYVEIDDDIVTDKGGVVGATNYITGLFNETIILYANESLEMGISEIKAWDTPAPYFGTSSSAMLSSYQANTGSFNGDLSHLVSYQASGGIAAGFSGICNSNPDNSKCFSSIDASYATVPNYSFSVMVVTHEMGHLIGSRHTHACVWNGNGTAIDGCAGQTEGSCSLPGFPSGGGTIMSYCHIQSVGINFNSGFGPQPGNVIRNTVANATCLPANCGGGGPTCFDGIQNGDETGVDCGGSSCPACPTPCNDNEVVISITLDNYPEETSWNVTNAGGSVVASGGTYGAQPDGSTVTETLCLVDGCYDFTIFDSYGDGICCSYGSGSYTVTSGGSTLASGGSFGSSEATNFCFGSSGPTCDDGVQNGNETGVDCGGSSCPACPTCFDGVQNGDETGVQNGDETGVDCGGSSCPACPSGGGEILGSYFETGWDGWQDGGSDCARYSGSYSWEGSFSIRIRDNSGTASAMTSPSLDLSGYSSIDVTFFFYANSMENGEDFWLRYYDGSNWTTVAAWAQGSSFNNNTFYTATVTISAASYNFSSNSAIRFQCDASTNADQVYIDAVTVTASTGGLIEAGPVVTTTELEGGHFGEEAERALNNVQLDLETAQVNTQPIRLFPNPARDVLMVRSEANMQSIRLMSATGQQLQQLSLDNDQHQLDISNLAPGLYYLLIEVDGELKPQRFVKE